MGDPETYFVRDAWFRDSRPFYRLYPMPPEQAKHMQELRTKVDSMNAAYSAKMDSIKVQMDSIKTKYPDLDKRTEEHDRLGKDWMGLVDESSRTVRPLASEYGGNFDKIAPLIYRGSVQSALRPGQILTKKELDALVKKGELELQKVPATKKN